MRKLILAASVTLLAACASPQKEEQINLTPTPTLSSLKLVNGQSFSLESRDIRTSQYVALVNSGRRTTQPIHTKQNLRIAIETAMYQQLVSQGFQMVANSNNTLSLEVQEALVNVSNTLMENELDAKVTLQVTAETPRGKLVKSYNGTATKTGTLSASNDDVELVLNDVVDLVLAEIANDKELLNYMKERF